LITNFFFWSWTYQWSFWSHNDLSLSLSL